MNADESGERGGKAFIMTQKVVKVIQSRRGYQFVKIEDFDRCWSLDNENFIRVFPKE